MFSEYKRLEKDYATEKRNNEELQSSLDSMVQELESNKPEIDELRADHSRLQTELVDMSGMVEQATHETRPNCERSPSMSWPAPSAVEGNRGSVSAIA